MKVNFEKFDKVCLEVINDSLVIMSLFTTMCLQYVSDEELPPFAGNFENYKECISGELFDKLSTNNIWETKDNDVYFCVRGEIINHLKSFIS